MSPEFSFANISVTVHRSVRSCKQIVLETTRYFEPPPSSQIAVDAGAAPAKNLQSNLALSHWIPQPEIRSGEELRDEQSRPVQILPDEDSGPSQTAFERGCDDHILQNRYE